MDTGVFVIAAGWTENGRDRIKRADWSRSFGRSRVQGVPISGGRMAGSVPHEFGRAPEPLGKLFANCCRVGVIQCGEGGKIFPGCGREECVAEGCAGQRGWLTREELD